MLPCLVSVLLTFEIQGVLKFKKKSVAKRLMLYKAKVAVCADIRTKHSTQSERHVEFFNVKAGGT